MEFIRTKSVQLRQLNNKNIFFITVLVVIAALFPLGTEYIFSDPHREYLPMSDALSKESALIWLHFVMDMLIGLSYLAISSTLAYLAYRAREDIPFLWMFVAFGAFIVTCGFSHFAATWTLWQPAYYMEGGVKIVTAVASVATAVALPSLVPKAFKLIEVAKISA